VRALYNILFTICFIVASPYYFVRMRRRGNWLPGFAERFGHYDVKFKQAITNRHVLWMHAVSVGVPLRHAPISGQRQALGPLLSWVQTVEFFVPEAFRLVHRCRRAE